MTRQGEQGEGLLTVTAIMAPAYPMSPAAIRAMSLNASKAGNDEEGNGGDTHGTKQIVGLGWGLFQGEVTARTA